MHDNELLSLENLDFIASFVAVTTVFWARVLCSLAAEDACFKMRITLGVVFIRSLVFHVCVPECSRNGSGMRPYLLVQEKFVWFRKSSQNAGLCPAEVLDSFSLTLPSISWESCVIYSSLILGTDAFRDWPFLKCFSCVSLVTAANFRLFLNVATFWRENATQLWRLN